MSAKKTTKPAEEVVAETVETPVEEVVETPVEPETMEASVDAETTEPEVEETSDDLAPEPIVKSNFLKVKARQFRGTFHDVKFNDDCVCEKISPETLEKWISHYGADQIEVIN